MAIQLTGANCHDSKQALLLLDAIPPLQGKLGRPRHRPDCMLGDRAYDAEKLRRALRARGVVPLLAMRNTENGSGLGRWRWVVERTFAWLNQFRRLRVRYEKLPEIHEALLSLACVLICWRFLQALQASRITARKESILHQEAATATSVMQRLVGLSASPKRVVMASRRRHREEHLFSSLLLHNPLSHSLALGARVLRGYVGEVYFRGVLHDNEKDFDAVNARHRPCACS